MLLNNIHHWIDLIFGDKQKGEKASYANNLFYPMTYEDNVKLDECTNEFERNAIELQIQGFGQTPIQLFTESHPQNNWRKLLIHQPSPGGKDIEKVLRNEIEELKAELKKTKKKQEDNINKQLREFKIIENKRKKKFNKWK